MKTIEDFIKGEHSILRRARLVALTQIAAAEAPDPGNPSDRGEPTNVLKTILDLPPGTRNDKNKLENFFNEYIPGGWIGTSDAEDELFLLNVPISGNPFWFDWG